MWTRAKAGDGRKLDYSKGSMILHRDGNIEAAGHGGNQQGAAAFLHIEPRKRRTSVILMNLEICRGVFELNSRLWRAV
jgi:hypothetical protein